jgi:hypothetical protein
MDIRNYFRHLGVEVKGKTRVFGDNESMVKSSTLPHSTLSKRHNALSYHRVREAIASDMMSLHHVPGEMNPADILSKHWGYSAIWKMLRLILFCADIEPPDPNDGKGGDKFSVKSGQDSDSGGQAEDDDAVMESGAESSEDSCGIGEGHG